MFHFFFYVILKPHCRTWTYNPCSQTSHVLLNELARCPTLHFRWPQEILFLVHTKQSLETLELWLIEWRPIVGKNLLFKAKQHTGIINNNAELEGGKWYKMIQGFFGWLWTQESILGRDCWYEYVWPTAYAYTCWKPRSHWPKAWPPSSKYQRIDDTVTVVIMGFYYLALSSIANNFSLWCLHCSICRSYTQEKRYLPVLAGSSTRKQRSQCAWKLSL